jgi:hypothetical protein
MALSQRGVVTASVDIIEIGSAQSFPIGNDDSVYAAWF